MNGPAKIKEVRFGGIDNPSSKKVKTDLTLY